MNVSFRHIALVVPDLRAAEAYYQSLFEMQLIGREAELGDGRWYTLPFDKDWRRLAGSLCFIGEVARQARYETLETVIQGG